MTHNKATVAAASTAFIRNLALLDAFVDEHGHASVPQKYVTTDGVALGHVVQSWRLRFNKGRLPQDHAEALASRAGWVWRASRKNRTVTADGTIAGIEENPFEERIRALRLFAHEHGHTQVPSVTVTLTGVNLGSWVQSQRSMYRQRQLPTSKRAVLSDAHIAALEAVPHWTWVSDSATTRWETKFAGLEAVVASTGTARMAKRDANADQEQIGKWVVMQRVQYRKGKLSAERIAKLEALPGWVWDASFVNDTFDARVEELRAYVAEHGNCRRYSATLDRWASRRRTDYARGELTQAKIDVLNSISGWEWHENRVRNTGPTPPRKKAPTPKPKKVMATGLRPLSQTMQSNLDRIAAYAKEHGHARVPHLHVEADGMRLGLVVKNLQDRQDTLHPDMIAGLNAIAGWTWTKPASWELDEALAALDAFIAEHGHARVPRGHVTDRGVQLGARVETWRRQALAAQLPTELVRELESKRGWLWSRSATTLAA
ncbi:helicase associated domain-containing protein [Curtobacterium citreum]